MNLGKGARSAAGSTTELASTISDFEEVRLEDMSRSASGEEVGWSGEEESIASQGARPADEAATHKAQDKEGDAKDKAAAAPGGHDVAPDNLAPAKEGEPEISWRGTRTGPEPNTVNADGEPIYDPLKDLEFATAKVAEVAGQAAIKVSHKLVDKASAASRSLSQDAEISKHWMSLKDSATKAGTNISKIADNMSTWWANLDPVQKGSPSPEGHGSRPVATQDADRIQELFGFSEEEEVMESFDVKLRQTLSCTHNTFTTPQEIDIPGTMYITDKHTCFATASGDVCFSLPHKTQQTVKKLLQGVGSGACEVLLIAFGKEEHVVFTGFQAADLTSALALLEHLTSSE